MRTPYKIATLATLATLACAACESDDDTALAPDTTTPAASASVITTTAPVAADSATTAPDLTPTSSVPTTPATAPGSTAAPPTATSDLPPCDTVQPELTDAGATHPDCSLTTAGFAGSVYLVTFGAADVATGDAPMTITALDGNQPAIEEAVGATFESPFLQDLDRDDVEELLVPLFTGAQNTAYAIWARPAPGEAFVRAGEVGGLGFDVTADGYVVVSGHASASTSYADLYRLDAGSLVPIVELELDLERKTCTLTDSGGLASTGLDQAEAQDQFCADPAVAG